MAKKVNLNVRINSDLKKYVKDIANKKDLRVYEVMEYIIEFYKKNN